MKKESVLYRPEIIAIQTFELKCQAKKIVNEE
jgi:hypothetical protein